MSAEHNALFEGTPLGTSLYGDDIFADMGEFESGLLLPLNVGLDADNEEIGITEVLEPEPEPMEGVEVESTEYAFKSSIHAATPEKILASAAVASPKKPKSAAVTMVPNIGPTTTTISAPPSETQEVRLSQLYVFGQGFSDTPMVGNGKRATTKNDSNKQKTKTVFTISGNKRAHKDSNRAAAASSSSSSTVVGNTFTMYVPPSPDEVLEETIESAKLAYTLDAIPYTQHSIGTSAPLSRSDCNLPFMTQPQQQEEEGGGGDEELEDYQSQHKTKSAPSSSAITKIDRESLRCLMNLPGGAVPSLNKSKLQCLARSPYSGSPELLFPDPSWQGRVMCEIYTKQLYDINQSNQSNVMAGVQALASRHQTANVSEKIRFVSSLVNGGPLTTRNVYSAATQGLGLVLMYFNYERMNPNCKDLEHTSAQQPPRAPPEMMFSEILLAAGLACDNRHGVRSPTGTFRDTVSVPFGVTSMHTLQLVAAINASLVPDAPSVVLRNGNTLDMRSLLTNCGFAFGGNLGSLITSGSDSSFFHYLCCEGNVLADLFSDVMKSGYCRGADPSDVCSLAQTVRLLVTSDLHASGIPCPVKFHRNQQNQLNSLTLPCLHQFLDNWDSLTCRWITRLQENQSKTPVSKQVIPHRLEMFFAEMGHVAYGASNKECRHMMVTSLFRIGSIGLAIFCELVSSTMWKVWFELQKAGMTPNCVHYEEVVAKVLSPSTADALSDFYNTILCKWKLGFLNRTFGNTAFTGPEFALGQSSLIRLYSTMFIPDGSLGLETPLDITSIARHMVFRILEMHKKTPISQFTTSELASATIFDSIIGLLYRMDSRFAPEHSPPYANNNTDTNKRLNSVGACIPVPIAAETLIGFHTHASATPNTNAPAPNWRNDMPHIPDIFVLILWMCSVSCRRFESSVRSPLVEMLNDNTTLQYGNVDQGVFRFNAQNFPPSYRYTFPEGDVLRSSNGHPNDGRVCARCCSDSLRPFVRQVSKTPFFRTGGTSKKNSMRKKTTDLHLSKAYESLLPDPSKISEVRETGASLHDTMTALVRSLTALPWIMGPTIESHRRGRASKDAELVGDHMFVNPDIFKELCAASSLSRSYMTPVYLFGEIAAAFISYCMYVGDNAISEANRIREEAFGHVPSQSPWLGGVNNTSGNQDIDPVCGVGPSIPDETYIMTYALLKASRGTPINAAFFNAFMFVFVLNMDVEDDQNELDYRSANVPVGGPFTDPNVVQRLNSVLPDSSLVRTMDNADGPNSDITADIERYFRCLFRALKQSVIDHSRNPTACDSALFSPVAASPFHVDNITGCCEFKTIHNLCTFLRKFARNAGAPLLDSSCIGARNHVRQVSCVASALASMFPSLMIGDVDALHLAAAAHVKLSSTNQANEKSVSLSRLQKKSLSGSTCVAITPTFSFDSIRPEHFGALRTMRKHLAETPSAMHNLAAVMCLIRFLSLRPCKIFEQDKLAFHNKTCISKRATWLNAQRAQVISTVFDDKFRSMLVYRSCIDACTKSGRWFRNSAKMNEFTSMLQRGEMFRADMSVRSQVLNAIRERFAATPMFSQEQLLHSFFSELQKRRIDDVRVFVNSSRAKKAKQSVSNNTTANMSGEEFANAALGLKDTAAEIVES